LKPVPLLGHGFKSIDPLITSQRRLNVYYSVRTDGDRSSVFVLGTPGLTLFSAVPSSPIRGLLRVPGDAATDRVYIVAGSSVYVMLTATGAVTLVGGISTYVGTAPVVGMVYDGRHILIPDGTNLWQVDSSTNTLTVVVDANAPQTTLSVAYIDSLFLAVVPGATREFRQSVLLDPTTWTPLVSAFKESSGDPLIAIDAFNSTVVLWGESSIEFWSNIGTSPSPFQRVNGTTLAWGLTAVYSRVRIGNDIYFVGSNGESSIQVLVLSGYAVKPVSTEDVNNWLEKRVGFDVMPSAVGMAYSVNGHAMYCLSWPGTALSIMLDTLTGVWSELQTGSSGRYLGNLSTSSARGTLVADATTGNIYVVNAYSGTDNGVTIPREVCTKHLRDGGNTISVSELMIDMNTTEQSSGTVSLEVSKDGGINFGPVKTLSFSGANPRTSRAVVRRLGSAEDYVFRIKSVDSSPFILGNISAVVESDDS
jgi:hypothetical protein